MTTKISRADLAFLQKNIPQLDLNSINQCSEIFETARDIFHTTKNTSIEFNSKMLNLISKNSSKTDAGKMSEYAQHLDKRLSETLEQLAFYKSLTAFMAKRMAEKTPHLELVKKQ